MKVKTKSLEGKEGKEVTLPKQFSEEFRPDLIKRAVLAVQSHNIQAYGVNPDAGMRSSSRLSKRRKDYKTTYGPGRSRSPRKIMTRRGLHFYFVGAFAPNTVGGRTAHPPKAEKVWDQKINIKERRKAIRSAIAATMDSKLVKKRGHRTGSIILESKFESLTKTKDVEKMLKDLGFTEELERIAVKKIRAGVGKNRGRPYRKKKGPLFVVSGKCSLVKAAQNMQGIDICNVKDLNAELLAPGTDAGRLTIWSDKAIELMEKEKLYY
ncbi:MAG: 50S ribosomal protein L4 [Nanoarchaeota archaeon]|nr:50S ribosomal protein L4 [Nanoarchaeota archaeon]